MAKKSMSELAKSKNININEVKSRKPRATGAFGLASQFITEVAVAASDIWGLNLSENDSKLFSEGKLIVELDPHVLSDSVGSDRVGDWSQDLEFNELKLNIMERGQIQPVIVSYIENEQRFDLQSGRRRLRVCKELNKNVRVKLNTNNESGSIERYYENTVRKNLSMFEQLLSIHELNIEFGSNYNGSMTYDELVKKFNVPSKSYFSLAKFIHQNKDDLLSKKPHNKWTKALIIKEMDSKKAKKINHNKRTIDIKSGTASITKSNKGFKISISLVDENILSRLEEFLRNEIN